MKLFNLIIVVFPILFSYSIYANENFSFSDKIKCELSASFIVFDFDKKILIIKKLQEWIDTKITIILKPITEIIDETIITKTES